MKNTTWNTYTTRGYTFDAANDQASAGGVHHHQVRKSKGGWQRRICQSNGNHCAFGPAQAITDAEGESNYETAKTR